jgi:hypothetical protein
MKLSKNQIKSILIAIVLFLPIVLLNSCDTSEDDIIFTSEIKLTKESKIVSLMIASIQGRSVSIFSKSMTDEVKCTEFVYPMTFYAYSNDNEDPSAVNINSDEELLDFFESLNTLNQFFITYPVTLLDVDGNATVINDYPDLEGVLTMLVDACLDGSDDRDDSDDDDDDDVDDHGDDGGLGIRYAHFDVDTAHLVYDFNQGKTDAHTHEYDEKYDTNIVDYFNIETGGKTGSGALHNISDLDYSVPTNSEYFYIIVANADLSQDVQIEINSELIPVMDYQAQVDAFINGDADALKVYTLGTSQNAIQLTSLKFVVGMDAATIDNGLIPTETKTVRANTPGPNGEYRDGALIMQAIDVKSMSLNNDLRVADSSANLFWESTIFWHKKEGDNNDSSNNNGSTCGECKGEVDSLELKYLGDESNTTIKIYEGKVNDDKLFATFNNINKGDVLAFTGPKKDNKMGSKIKLTINDNDETSIHTSCSQDIKVGMNFGDFLVESGSSSKGGDFCKTDDNNSQYEYCYKNHKKINICHKGKTKCISINAIWGHLTHHSEDYLGSCNN